MKKTLFFLFIPFFISAQNCDPVIDTVAFVSFDNGDNNYYVEFSSLSMLDASEEEPLYFFFDGYFIWINFHSII